MNMRRYTLKDIPEMVRQMSDFCAKHEFYKTIPFSSERLTYVLNHNLTNTMMYCNVCEADNHELIAGFAAMTTGYAMSNAVFSEDIIGYVREGYRTGYAFEQLLQGYVDWATLRRVHDIRLTYTGDKTEGFSRLVQRLGFRKFGTMYAKEGA